MRGAGIRIAMWFGVAVAAGCSAGPIQVAAFDEGILKKDLVALWPMDDAAGSLVSKDRSINKRDGAIIGGTFVPGKFDSALHLELGSEVQVTPFPDTPADWTLVMWVLPEVVLVPPAPGPTGPTTRFVTLLSTEAVFSGGWEMNIALTSAANDSPHYQFGYYLGPGNSDYLTSSCMSMCLVKPEWTHLAVVVERGMTMKFYENGLLQDTKALPLPIKPGSPTLFMGRWQSPGNRQFKGALDDVAIYGRALSPIEIHALFEAPVPVP